MNKDVAYTDGEIDLIAGETGGRKGIYYYKIQKSGSSEVYGHCYLLADNEKPCHMGNGGFYIAEQYRGREYAVKACRLLLQAAVQIGMKAVFFAVNKDNIASRRVCEKLGCCCLGTIGPEEHAENYSESALERDLYQFIL